MKFLITLILFIIFNTAKAEDYIIQFQAKVKNLKEFSISNGLALTDFEIQYIQKFFQNSNHHGEMN